MKISICIVGLIIFLSFKPAHSNPLDSLHVNIYYNTNEYRLSNHNQKSIKLFIDKIDSLNVISLNVMGYCDSIGTNKYNDRLSTLRAVEVKKYLKGIEKYSNLLDKCFGLGEELAFKKKGINQLALNRRVSITAVFNENLNYRAEYDAGRRLNSIEGKIEVGDLLTIDGLEFHGGRVDLLPESEIVLNNILDYLLIHENIEFDVLGHVCCTKNGIDAYNGYSKKNDLSEGRARAIKYYLYKHGIDSNRIGYKGMAGKYPLIGTNLNNTLNRRVEFWITKL